MVAPVLLIASCTTQQEGKFLVAPGGYELYNCQQLATQVAAQRKREAELVRLIAKAKQGPAGSVVSAMSYEPDLAIARATLRKLHAEQVNQNCSATPASSGTPLAR
jgi:hypothetical protein